MNASLQIKSIRKNTIERKMQNNKEIELIRSYKDIINELDKLDWSWHVNPSTYQSIKLFAEIYCENEEDIKNSCRFARTLTHSKSIKELDALDGKMSYQHSSKDKQIYLIVNGGQVTKGCKLILKTSYSEPYKIERFEMVCK